MSRKRVNLLSISHESTRSDIILIFLIIMSCNFTLSSSESDVDVLRKFKESFKNTDALSDWDKNGSPCNGSHVIWTGVLCDKEGRVWGLKLEHMELNGVVDVDTLTKLPDLRTISVMNNKLEGTLPNLTKLGSLKSIYLSNNKFSGEIPVSSFNHMMSLKKLHMANNEFSGWIPTTLASLPKLLELRLENNEFEGHLPSFEQIKLHDFNASNNKLEGQIPATLSRFNASSFAGNEDLCGAPLEVCTPNRKNLSVVTIAIVSVLVALAVIALIIAVLVILHRRKQPSSPEHAPPNNAPTGAATTRRSSAASGSDIEQGRRSMASAAGSSSPGKHLVKLTFLTDRGERFDMTDLLKASAEVLGGGVFGSTYKAVLNDGNKLLVVKRFKQMSDVSKEEFTEHMWRLGRLNHQNVHPIMAYYYRKEEKLLVMDYVPNVSLAFQLHGSRCRGTALGWPVRLSIIKGVANGLLYLNNELPSLTAAHGHLKSSNVLLDNNFRPLLTDYGLIPIVNTDHARHHMIAYKSPEFRDRYRITKKTDIWSLGILILEVLTGRFPSNLLQPGTGGTGASDVDLAIWVDSLVRDRSMEVFDSNLAAAGTSGGPCHGEMMKLLRIGLSCCQADADRRPDVREAAEKIEEIREKDVDDEFHSSYTSEADMRSRSSRGLSDEFKDN